MNSNLIWVIDHKANTIVPHTHDFYQMMFCKKAGGLVTIGDTTFEAKQDYVYFVQPNTMHSIVQKKNMQTIDLNFSVSDEETRQYLSNVPPEFQINDIVFMKMLFLFIAKEATEGKKFSGDTISHALRLLLIKTIDEFNDTSVRTQYDYHMLYDITESEKSNTDDLILNLKDYIEENISEDIKLEELADRVHLSKTYFVKRFKVLFGSSPMKYITDMRIEKSKQMIIDGKLSIQQISNEVGYKSLHHFSAAFKQNVGMSPTEYHKYFNSE